MINDLAARLPVRSSRLHDRWLRCRDARLGVGSIFPLFDRDGIVALHMLIEQDSSRIALLDHRIGLFRVGLFGVAIDVDVGSIGVAGANDRSRIERLHHFDPWWALGRPEFEGHPLRETIKATNIVDRVGPNLTDAEFDSEVGRFRRVRPGKQKFRPVRLDRLPLRKPTRFGAVSCSGWRLDPFWVRPN